MSTIKIGAKLQLVLYFLFKFPSFFLLTILFMHLSNVSPIKRKSPCSIAAAFKITDLLLKHVWNVCTMRKRSDTAASFFFFSLIYYDLLTFLSIAC